MEKFVIVWWWEGAEFKVLSIEDTMEEAKKKVKKKLKPFLADNEDIVGKFDVDEYVKEHGSFDGSATEFCNLIQARKKPQSISGKLWNRKNELAKMGFIFTREHTREGSHITFSKVDQQPEKQEAPNKSGCYPFDLVISESLVENHIYGGDKTVTSSQSSQ